MPIKRDLFSNIYKPDVLSCLADLSNDEVFTPPEVANKMLDMLPQEIFADKNVKFLDPACKSGVFLREIAKRLIKGLEKEIPDLQERCDWIFHNQLYGIAITELTSLLSRRSVYCSKYANSPFSISKFDNVYGNILYHKIKHTWKNKKCVYCGIAEDSELNDISREGMETHAYEFIHTLHPEEIINMKFDVIIGNPPYQLDTNGAGKQAKPIYQFFVQQAQKMNPRYIVMITPSRWLSGGMGLDNYRESMLNDGRIKMMTDYSLSTDCFPGVDIAGGVSYFLWDRNYQGNCKYTYIDNGKATTMERNLGEFPVYVRNNEALSIIHKVRKLQEDSISSLMSSLGPFGLGTSERGIDQSTGNCYTLLSSAGRSFIQRDKVTNGHEYIDKWKVILGKATSAGAATADKSGQRKVLATLSLLEPGAVCTFSYFIAAAFDDEDQAENCRYYLSTKFARFLLLQTLSSINVSRERFYFVPIQDFTQKWDDKSLYEKYDLTDSEQGLIESMIKDWED